MQRNQRDSILRSRSSQAVRRAAARRGVLLLVVLSLLVLFAMVGVTFVLVAGQYRDKTRMAVREEQYGDNPRYMLDSIFAQCIRDTTNPHSVLRGHSLLADMYGNDGVRGFLNSTGGSITPIAGMPFIDLTVPGTDIDALFYYPAPTAGNMERRNPVVLPAQYQTSGYYNGCVLTMVDGPAAGRSTRIVGWWYDGSNYRIRVLAFDGAAGLPALGNRFIVNGRPFNGTGFGFDPSANPASAVTLLQSTQRISIPSGPVDVPYALLPNAVFADSSRPPDQLFPTLNKLISASGNVRPVGGTASYPQFGGIGGADEDYDAPDAQNMLLAYLPLRPTAGTTNPGEIIPSLHRPAVVDNVGNIADGLTNDKAKYLLKRQASLRPQLDLTNPSSPKGHIYFVPLDNPTVGPFDVDNDGDGIAESIWVDVGLGVRTAPDGRTYKPLAAILCLDLDGRLNVNAHGSVAQVDDYFFNGTLKTNFESNINPSAYNGGVPTLQHGQGYGPAEINLYRLFSTTTSPPMTTNATITAYRQLLRARYAEPNANLNNSAYDSSAAMRTQPYPGETRWNDLLAALKLNEYPYSTSALSGFGTPHDLWGRGFPFLDVRGMPLWPYMGSTSDMVDDPYELNLSRDAPRLAPLPTSATPSPGSTPKPHDSPFSVAELERILRMYDIDARQLPDRLRQLVDGAGRTLPDVRGMITTDSFDLPSPNMLPTRDMRRRAVPAGLPQLNCSIIDMLRLRLAGSGANVENEARKILPPEVVAGLRMDINRPFGNGRDDNGNGVVDEPSESEMSFWDPSRVPATNFGTVMPQLTNGIDVNNDGMVDATDARLARQLYARHLYILMMLFKTEYVDMDFDGDPGNNTPAETARGIAQWAVNVVDFRDRDSIMTPFEFDTEPFDSDGWSVDGDPNTYNPATETNRMVVWGCERPEMLLSETLAWHDRRTEDLVEGAVDSSDPNDTESMPGTTTETMMTKKDSDFDQKFRPFGPFFVELYNPWVTQESVRDGTAGRPSALEASGEFHNLNLSTNHADGVILDRTSPGGSPAWRMIVVKGGSMLADPDDRYPGAGTAFVKSDVNRAVYFVQPTATIVSNDLTSAVSYYPDPSEVPAPLLPGRYAVVGSAGLPGRSVPANHMYVSPIGRQVGDGSGGQWGTTRRIVLMPDSNPNTPQVSVVDNYPVPNFEPSPGDPQPAVAVALSRGIVGGTPQTFPSVMASISEPQAGYAADAMLNYGPEPQYPQILDIPVDKTNAELAGLIAGPSEQPRDGTALNFRVIHLQRLADPTLDWNPEVGDAGHNSAIPVNPYLTIDTMSIDLTVFNGASDSSGTKDMRVGAPLNAAAGIASYQRGDSPSTGNAPLWGRQPFNNNAPNALNTSSIGHNFPPALLHSLGFLNQAYGSARAATAYVDADVTTGGGLLPPAYKGAPKNNPFPWLTWNNRPYVGPMELLLVPRSRSSRLLSDFNPTLPAQPYSTTLTAQTNGHLLNPFALSTTTLAADSTQLHRVFEYLTVPSRFVGTETYFDPAAMVGTLSLERELMAYYHPPFNKVSNYREPGRVNINTIPCDEFGPPPTSSVWDGILNAAPGGTGTPTWPDVFQSRQGGASVTGYTSYFGNPFRSAAGAALLLPGVQGAPLPLSTATATHDEVDVTLMRPVDPSANSQPLLDYVSANSYDNTGRNPYFRNKTLQRLSNLLTTRSNVYAIWITIGYFEVEPVVPNEVGLSSTELLDVFPDGYWLRQEMGSETGEVTRHRAFYIYDRSIPVGFEPGKDHNYKDGLLLRRFIE